VTGLAELIAKGLEILTDLIPRLKLVPRTCRAVVWILGFRPRALYGLLVIWPVFETVEDADLREDATRFQPTVLWTKDGHEVAVGSVLTWAIEDPVTVHETINDVQGWVEEKTESVLPELVGAYTLSELQRKAAGAADGKWALNQHLLVKAKKLLEPKGIRAIDARVSFTSRTRVFRLLGDPAVVE
jgi:regulator of protease activity HflC (stomatin/prohibitin superfamily)